MATFTSQNVGAKRIDRAKEGLKGGLVSVITIALLSTAIYLIFAKQLVGVFINHSNKEIIDIGSQFLYVLAPKTQSHSYNKVGHCAGRKACHISCASYKSVEYYFDTYHNVEGGEYV